MTSVESISTLHTNFLDQDFDRLTRGPKWGLAYSKVYQCFVGTIMPHLECEDLNAEMLNRMGGRR